jgi:hypothetical protein
LGVCLAAGTIQTNTPKQFTDRHKVHRGEAWAIKMNGLPFVDKIENQLDLHSEFYLA